MMKSLQKTHLSIKTKNIHHNIHLSLSWCLNPLYLRNDNHVSHYQIADLLRRRVFHQHGTVTAPLAMNDRRFMTGKNNNRNNG